MERIEDHDAGIYLRPMTCADTDRIVAWRNSENVRRNFIYQELFTRESHENWIKTMVETGRVVQMIICMLEDGKPVGSVYIRDIDRRHSKAEYGIFIGEKGAVSKGYATQAAELMKAYAFRRLGLHKLTLRVLAENQRARRSYEKAGFCQEGYLKEEVRLKDGRYHDVVLMACFQEEKEEKGGAD